MPRATTSAVVFSGGGDGPLAILDSEARELAFDWPGALPKPAIDGPNATYPEVLPGVDLRLTVTEFGGFTQLLVVKTAEAAANPRLAKLKMQVVSDELDVAANATGVMRAVDAAGVEVLAAAPPSCGTPKTPVPSGEHPPPLGTRRLTAPSTTARPLRSTSRSTGKRSL